MPEVTASVEKIQNKKAKNNDVYTTISLKGQKRSFYDWDGHCARAGVTAGDTVRIEHDGSGFPRIKGLEKAGPSKPTETSESEGQEIENVRSARMCALRCAASVLQGSDLKYEERVGKLIGLAEKIENWIME